MNCPSSLRLSQENCKGISRHLVFLTDRIIFKLEQSWDKRQMLQTYRLSSNVHLALFYPAISSLLSGDPCIHNITEVIVQLFIQLWLTTFTFTKIYMAWYMVWQMTDKTISRFSRLLYLMKPSLLLQQQTKGWIVHITVGGDKSNSWRGHPWMFLRKTRDIF